MYGVAGYPVTGDGRGAAAAAAAAAADGAAAGSSGRRRGGGGGGIGAAIERADRDRDRQSRRHYQQQQQQQHQHQQYQQQLSYNYQQQQQQQQQRHRRNDGSRRQSSAHGAAGSGGRMSLNSNTSASAATTTTTWTSAASALSLGEGAGGPTSAFSLPPPRSAHEHDDGGGQARSTPPPSRAKQGPSGGGGGGGGAGRQAPGSAPAKMASASSSSASSKHIVKSVTCCLTETYSAAKRAGPAQALASAPSCEAAAATASGAALLRAAGLVPGMGVGPAGGGSASSALVHAGRLGAAARDRIHHQPYSHHSLLQQNSSSSSSSSASSTISTTSGFVRGKKRVSPSQLEEQPTKMVAMVGGVTAGALAGGPVPAAAATAAGLGGGIMSGYNAGMATPAGSSAQSQLAYHRHLGTLSGVGGVGPGQLGQLDALHPHMMLAKQTSVVPEETAADMESSPASSLTKSEAEVLKQQLEMAVGVPNTGGGGAGMEGHVAGEGTASMATAAAAAASLATAAVPTTATTTANTASNQASTSSAEATSLLRAALKAQENAVAAVVTAKNHAAPRRRSASSRDAAAAAATAAVANNASITSQAKERNTKSSAAFPSSSFAESVSTLNSTLAAAAKDAMVAAAAAAALSAVAAPAIPLEKLYPRGECLTQPSAPESNGGMDNSEGNLIVHRNDILKVAAGAVHVHRPGRRHGNGRGAYGDKSDDGGGGNNGSGGGKGAEGSSSSTSSSSRRRKSGGNGNNGGSGGGQRRRGGGGNGNTTTSAAAAAMGAATSYGDEKGDKAALAEALGIPAPSSSSSATHSSSSSAAPSPRTPDLTTTPGLENVFDSSGAGGAAGAHSKAAPLSSPPRPRLPDTLSFRVLSLLGQGTFAQVFRCVCVESGRTVALKVVKNRPAYTRQAAVEIDIFRALGEDAAPLPDATVGEGEDGEMAGLVDGMIVGGGAGTGMAGVGGMSATAGGGRGGGQGATDCSGSGSTSASGDRASGGSEGAANAASGPATHMVNLLCYFMHSSHLCLVFELLGPNLYEVLKRRQFRGLPIGTVRSLVAQALHGVRELSQRGVVHCDLKPENILLAKTEDKSAVQIGTPAAAAAKGGGGGGGKASANSSAAAPAPSSVDGGKDDADAVEVVCTTTAASSSAQAGQPLIRDRHRIKLIDFGSACFEGQSAHTYIQSRFYRSPEVLVGLEYDSAIDMWSLGCVAAELFLGLPILPGVHEHDQLCRIVEMIGELPDWMVDEGTKSSKYYVKMPKENDLSVAANAMFGVGVGGIAGGRDSLSTASSSLSGGRQSSHRWRLKTRDEYIRSLSSDERQRRGGLAKLEQQSATNRYFKRKRLADIVELHGHCGPNGGTEAEREGVALFVHFLRGILDPDPWKRWTAHQASMHPFVTGSKNYRRVGVDFVSLASAGGMETTGAAVGGAGARRHNDIGWVPPWDPTICRRKLLSVQKAREKQQAAALLRGGRFSSSSGRHQQQAITDVGAGVLQASPDRLAMSLRGDYTSPAGTSRVTAMTDAMSLSKSMQSHSSLYPVAGAALSVDGSSPPSALQPSRRSSRAQSGGIAQSLPSHAMASSLGAAVGTLQYDPTSGRFVDVSTSSATAAAAAAAAALAPSYYASLAQAQVQQQAMGGGTLGSSLGPMDGRSYSAASVGVPPAASVAASGVPGGAYGDYSYAATAIPTHLTAPPPMATMGPQSFSGVYYDSGMPGGGQHAAMAGDLGYALQRPGVFPGGMQGDATAMTGANMTPLSYLSQTMQSRPSTLVRSGSFSNQGGRRQRGQSFSTLGSSFPGVAMQGGSQSATVMSASPQVQPLSLNFDGRQTGQMLTDSSAMGLRIGQGIGASLGGMSSGRAPTCGGNAMSLLSQQLADHSAQTQQMGLSDNVGQQMTLQSQDMQQQQQDGVGMLTYPQGQSSMYDPVGASGSLGAAAGSMGSYQGGYYGYVGAGGTPMMMSAPSNVDPRGMPSYASSVAAAGHFLPSAAAAATGGSYGGSYSDGLYMQGASFVMQPPQHLPSQQMQQAVSHLPQQQQAYFMDGSMLRQYAASNLASSIDENYPQPPLQPPPATGPASAYYGGNTS